MKGFWTASFAACKGAKGIKAQAPKFEHPVCPHLDGVPVGEIVPVGHVYPNAMTSRRDEIGICDKSWRAAPMQELYAFWHGERTLVKIKGHEGFYLVNAEIKKDEA